MNFKNKTLAIVAVCLIALSCLGAALDVNSWDRPAQVSLLALSVLSIKPVSRYLFVQLEKLTDPDRILIGSPERRRWQCGAVTVNPITNPSGIAPYKSLAVFQIIATADADITATCTHNFALTAAQQPNTEVTFTMMQSQIAAAVSGWCVTARGANSITATKNATVATGLAGAQVEARVRVPHTLNC